ncbi:MAG: hypothetical protein K8S54_17685 [Spirochaetia bacterium]|nr:hypothetical protein [Spirochaetia bacterium]
MQLKYLPFISILFLSLSASFAEGEPKNDSVFQPTEDRFDMSVFALGGYSQYSGFREWQGKLGLEKSFFTNHLGLTLALTGSSASCYAKCRSNSSLLLLVLQNSQGISNDQIGRSFATRTPGGTNRVASSHTYTFDPGLNFHFLPTYLFDPYAGLTVGVGKSNGMTGTTTKQSVLAGLRMNVSKDFFLFTELAAEAYQLRSKSRGERGRQGESTTQNQRKNVLSFGAGFNF